MTQELLLTKLQLFMRAPYFFREGEHPGLKFENLDIHEEKQKFINQLSENGYCFGLSLCHTTMNLLGKDKWWDGALRAVCGWDGNSESLNNEIILPDSDLSEPTPKLRDIFKRVLDYTVYNHGVSNTSYDSSFMLQNVSQESFLDPTQTFFSFVDTAGNQQKIYQRESIVGIFSEKELTSILEHEQSNFTENICLLHFHRHCITLHYKPDQGWFIYDPNFPHEPDSTNHPIAWDFKTAEETAGMLQYLRGKAIRIEFASVSNLKPLKINTPISTLINGMTREEPFMDGFNCINYLLAFSDKNYIFSKILVMIANIDDPIDKQASLDLFMDATIRIPINQINLVGSQSLATAIELILELESSEFTQLYLKQLYKSLIKKNTEGKTALDQIVESDKQHKVTGQLLKLPNCEIKEQILALLMQSLLEQKTTSTYVFVMRSILSNLSLNNKNSCAIEMFESLTQLNPEGLTKLHLMAMESPSPLSHFLFSLEQVDGATRETCLSKLSNAIQKRFENVSGLHFIITFAPKELPIILKYIPVEAINELSAIITIVKETVEPEEKKLMITDLVTALISKGDNGGLTSLHIIARDNPELLSNIYELIPTELIEQLPNINAFKEINNNTAAYRSMLSDLREDNNHEKGEEIMSSKKTE